MSKATARRPLAVGMPVPVMDVRVVRVSVFERGVDVFVDMRFAGRIVRFVRMLVMRCIIKCYSQGHSITQRPDPVSYTHLDVYKRQDGAGFRTGDGPRPS